MLWRQGSIQGKAPVQRERSGRKGWWMAQSRRVVLKPPGPGTLGHGGSRVLVKVPLNELANGAEASAAFAKPEHLGANAELLRWGEGRSARNFWGLIIGRPRDLGPGGGVERCALGVGFRRCSPEFG